MLQAFPSVWLTVREDNKPGKTVARPIDAVIGRDSFDAANRAGMKPALVPPYSLHIWAVLLSSLLLLSGCGSLLTATTADVAGIAGAGAASAVTKSPAAAAGIGLGIAAGANAGLQYAERKVHRAEQDRIASVAGGLEPGAVGTWSVSHDIPIEDDEHGSLAVTRTLGTPDFTCKEIVFSVDTDKDNQVRRAFYTAMVCRDGTMWKWATAEPATERWGSLQ